MKNTAVPGKFLLYALTFVVVTLGNSQTAFSQVKQQLDSLHQAFIGEIDVAQKQSPHNSREEALADILANELENVGVEMNQKETDAMVQAMVEGGTAAMNAAFFIAYSIVEIETKPNNDGDAGAKKTAVTLTDQQVNNMLQHLKKGKNANLALTQFLQPRLIALKEKNKKSKGSSDDPAVKKN